MGSGNRNTYYISMPEPMYIVHIIYIEHRNNVIAGICNIER